MQCDAFVGRMAGQSDGSGDLLISNSGVVEQVAHGAHSPAECSRHPGTTSVMIRVVPQHAGAVGGECGQLDGRINGVQNLCAPIDDPQLCVLVLGSICDDALITKPSGGVGDSTLTFRYATRWCSNRANFKRTSPWGSISSAMHSSSIAISIKSWRTSGRS